MATRRFRTEESIAAERGTRQRVEPLLERHGIEVTGRRLIERGTAVTQVIEARLDALPIRMHVRLCWRRDGRNPREQLYSAAQLKARLDQGGWEQTLANVMNRHVREGHSHLLLVQDSKEGFALAALVPSKALGAIWERQRSISADLMARGLSGTLVQNHATNGASPTLWLQDDRFRETGAVARALWDWPGVINVLKLPRVPSIERDTDTLDDLVGQEDPGRDAAERRPQLRSGYPRNPKVRALVIERSGGQCESPGCGEGRSYPGFLDVHHILGVDVSDRPWTCVALCPNCHREAHFAPEKEAINASLAAFAVRFGAIGQ
ncbi:HNH endonuclease signature motif containing protein [Sphingomonas kyeonggiensis]|uniref:5-methylcytosine-specific restriction protein A n=1 Tax=Sphingomonas kyeonggiensis TaxID=1268553 RepID=A0A7W6JPZ8_9SPHN|nr:HNH endonuclease signature motif containing protein [Sphingomonas kyeonggiensis]MBB4097452.1 5-methylcytosine-specific restriction protein A [Sphingomonas kyeonggiensis]